MPTIPAAVTAASTTAVPAEEQHVTTVLGSREYPCGPQNSPDCTIVCTEEEGYPVDQPIEPPMLYSEPGASAPTTYDLPAIPTTPP